MEYESIDAEQKLNVINQQIAAKESDHFATTLNLKTAPNEVDKKTYQTRLSEIESQVNDLKDERKKLGGN